MNYRILVPFWGNNPKYIALLAQWFEAYKRSGTGAHVTLITDEQTEKFGAYDWFTVPTPRYESQYQFDHKGDLVCAAVERILDPVLVLDADAVLQKDPEPLLWPYHDKAFAMPLDEGAFKRTLRNRNGVPTDIKKRCAGVLWFGKAHGRQVLTADYRRAFAELKTNKYLEERRLYEQHAWSLVAYINGAPVLPRELNWLANNSGLGPNPNAAIYHNIGQRKFSCPRT